MGEDNRQLYTLAGGAGDQPSTGVPAALKEDSSQFVLQPQILDFTLDFGVYYLSGQSACTKSNIT